MTPITNTGMSITLTGSRHQTGWAWRLRFIKSSFPIEKLTGMLGWPGDVSSRLVRFIGIAEAAGAIGLVLPVLTGTLPWLTPLAALGLGIIQILAIRVHVRRGELNIVPVNVVLLLLSAFIFWGYRGLLGL